MTLELFGEDLTDEIRSLARQRILHGGNLGTASVSHADAKLALLLVRELNPLEHLSRDERAILMGVTKQTVTTMDQDKKFVHVVNH